MKVDRKRVIAVLHNGVLIAQDAAHAERAKQLILTARDDTLASVQRLNGVEGIEAELVDITAEEWAAMHDEE